MFFSPPPRRSFSNLPARFHAQPALGAMTRLDALLARMTAAREGSGEDLDEALRAEVDALADRNAFLVDLLPLAWISVFENASLGEVELDGSRATIPVRYLDSELERTPGTVELVRERGVWKVDAFQGG